MKRILPGGWRRSPAFAAAVALVVLLVVLANATAFSAVWGVLYKPLPYRDAGELVELRIDLRDIDFQVGLSHAMYARVRQATGEFSGAIGSAEAWQPRLDDAGEPWRLQRVTPDFTVVLGVEAALGRTLSETGDAELLLSERVWRSRFGADPGVLGSVVQIGTERYVVTGVMPAGFAWPDSDADAWTRYVPTVVEREQELAGGFGVFHVSARMAPDATLEEARARLETILRDSGNAFLRDNTATARADARPWRARFTTGVVQPLLLLQAAALMLLVVAGANIANLTVERVTARHGEFALRRALGASWMHLVRVVVADLVPPALVGAVAGLALAVPVLSIVRERGLVPDGLVAPGLEPPLFVAGLVSAVLVVFVAAVAGMATAASGARATVGQARSWRGGVLRAGMLVAQVAIAVAMCGSAGLLLRSAMALHAEDRGFDASGVLMTQVDLGAVEPGAGGGAVDAGVAAALGRVREAIARQPGVTHVALVDMPPFGGAEFKTSVLTSMTDAAVEVRVASVDPDYFEAMGIRLLAGSVFANEPGPDVIPVVVDQLFATRWLAAGSGVGSTVRLVQQGTPPIDAQVVGIAPSVKQRALSEPAQPMLYLPMAGAPATTFLVIRTRADPAALASVVQRELQRLAPGAVLMFNEPLALAVRRSTAAARSLTEVAVLLGASTGVLCALGCFALLGAAANRRRAELGLRMALGATAPRIQMLVLRQGAVLIGSGVLVGVMTGLLVAQALGDRLYRIAPDDAATWFAAAVVVASLAMLASWLPANRAAHVSPTVALAEGSRQL